MSDSVNAVKEVGKAYGQAAQNAWDRFVKCTQASINGDDPGNCDLSQTVADIAENNYEKYKTLLRLAMMEGGASAEEADQWIESHAKDVWNKAQTVRQSKVLKEAVKKTRFTFGKLAALLALGFLTIKGAIIYNQGPMRLPGHIVDPVASAPSPYSSDQPAFTVLTLPEVEEVLAAPLPAQAALPAPVAAVAPLPLAVIVVDPQTGASRTITTTVGTAYNHIPATRSYIDERADEEQPRTDAQSARHTSLDANPNNTLHSGEVNPPWKFPSKLTTGDVNSKGSFDGDKKDLYH
jgi:hypothetical protein